MMKMYKDNHGYAMQLVVITSAIVLVMISMVSVLVVSESKSFDRAKRTEQAYALAKEGIKVAFARLEDNEDNTSPNFTAGPTGRQYTVSYDANTKVLNSTGTISTSYGDISKSISVKVIENLLNYNFTETFSTTTKRDGPATTANWNTAAGNVKTTTATNEVIYIADYLWGIRKYSTSGTYLQGWYLPSGPKYLTVDQNNDLWVYWQNSSGNRARIYKYNSNGVLYSGYYKVPVIYYQTHWSLSSEGNYLYLPHSSGKKTWKHDLDFTYVTDWSHSAYPYGPYDIAVKNGIVYTVKWENSKYIIRKQSTTGGNLGTLSNTSYQKISSLAIDSSNNIYVADWKYVEGSAGTCYIRKFNSSMTQLNYYGGTCGSGAGQWAKGQVGGIDVDSDGYVYTVSEQGYYSRLQKFSSTLEYIGSWARAGGSRYWGLAIGDDVSITGKVAQSTEVDAIAETIRKATLNAAQTLNGKTITYEMSANGGTNWQTVTPGTELEFTNTGSDLRWKATLNTADPTISPLIDEISIDYNAGANYKMDYSTWRTD